MHSRHDVTIQPWRRRAFHILSEGAGGLMEEPEESREWIRKKVSTRKALTTFLHHSNSFVHMQLVELFWSCSDDDFHHVLLNGRNIKLKESRPLYLLNEIPKIYLETYGFAWLVWISAQYLFVPLHILEILFDNIPTPSYFSDDDARNKFTDRAKRLVFDKNWLVALYAHLKGWSDVPLNHNIFSDAVSLCVKKQDTKWLRWLMTKTDNVLELLCAEVRKSRSVLELKWLIDTQLLPASEEALIALVDVRAFIDVLVQRGSYDSKIIRQARYLHDLIVVKKETTTHQLRAFKNVEDAVVSLSKRS